MFISNFEKNRINSRIQSLEICVDNLTKALSALSSKPKKKPMTPEQREKQRQYVRAYNARKKAEKAQQVAA
jgi:uncharacterized protein YeaC (DUF1315 family)